MTAREQLIELIPNEVIRNSCRTREIDLPIGIMFELVLTQRGLRKRDEECGSDFTDNSEAKFVTIRGRNGSRHSGINGRLTIGNLKNKENCLLRICVATSPTTLDENQELMFFKIPYEAPEGEPFGWGHFLAKESRNGNKNGKRIDKTWPEFSKAFKTYQVDPDQIAL